MLFKSAFSRTICRLLMGSILFVQIAVAAYACPSLAVRESNISAMTAHAESMPVDCDQMTGTLDPAAPSLCFAHCHNHEQSADHAEVAVLPPALFAALYWLAAPALIESLAQTTGSSVPHTSHPPPHAILHCCFRI